MKTLKYEEVHRNEYRDLAEARAEIRTFPEKIYNRKRLQSALGYVPPADFEAGLVAQQKEAAARQLSFLLSFFRHREIFRSDMFDWSGGGISAVPGLIGCDEFPDGYSSADCFRAGSASVDHFALKSSCQSMVFHRTAFSVLTVCLSPGGHPKQQRWASSH
jgi:hypothetical protein